ncbi:hypothetical protein Acor_56700 [Acrocarpospora corrugata]|uniref:DUF1349 domain-containing protein n=1 Tax=Acrocarpospora corrugata TaxID=35763 RepID=A0A5M3W485_9ACTN|nr:DUF1349 domain-containing protein [Acrocarpospora corrugata]GES03604.1 hypothetical protein Acor_56700 [Acrocarpospora corrugata]
MDWINEPETWTAGDETLTLTVPAKTDLWQETHYGYSFDNAPMYGRVIEGDLRVTVTFDADYAEQYDQAGAILRIDEKNWIKAGTEYVDGALQISVVVTRGFSDWSVQPAPGSPSSVTIDLHREGDAVTVKYGVDGAEPTTLIRLAYFPPGTPALAGAMAAAPVGSGFAARFTKVSLS